MTRPLHSLPKTLPAHDSPLDQPCQRLVSSTHCLKHHQHTTVLLINHVNDSSPPLTAENITGTRQSSWSTMSMTRPLHSLPKTLPAHDSPLEQPRRLFHSLPKTLLAFDSPLDRLRSRPLHSWPNTLLACFWTLWPQQSTSSTTSNEIREADAFLHSFSCVCLNHFSTTGRRLVQISLNDDIKEANPSPPVPYRYWHFNSSHVSNTTCLLHLLQGQSA
jgi:hypothetical protein